MSTSARVVAHRNRVDAAFFRVRQLRSEDLEVQSDFARYLCVLVSGLVETVVAELASEFCRHCAAPTVSNYAQSQLATLRNMKAQRLVELLGAFDPRWRSQFEFFMAGERRDALDSVVALRNKIAHGDSVGVTYTRVRGYYDRVVEILDFVDEKFTWS